MKLSNAILRPGRVIEVLEAGNIKVDAPGLFSREDIESLPPVMPFFGLHANTYSEPKIGQEIWVLNVTNNPLQLFWFRKDDRQGNTDIEGETNVEVICNREGGFGWATIYFSDGTGWMIRNDDSYLQIDPMGNIVMNGINFRCQTETSVLGASGGSHAMVLGDELEKVLCKIQGALAAVQQAAMTSPYTVGIANALGSTPMELANAIPNVSSTTCAILE